jgi:hypothetical protein
MATVGSSYQDDQVRGHDLAKSRFWGGLLAQVGRAGTAAIAADDWDREDNIRRGLDVVETAARAVNPNWWNCDDKQSLAGWHHQSRPTLAGKKHAEPYISRLDVEEAAAEYFALPYRVDGLDRLLTDMLMAAEMFAFADEMQPQLKQKLPTGLSWLWNNLKSLVIGLSIAGVLVWLAPDSNVALWIAGIVAGVMVLSVGFSLVVFPFAYPGVRAQRQKFHATVMGMVDAYTALDGSPASVPHIRKLVDRATGSGVVWPAPLMALLDDIAERRKAIDVTPAFHPAATRDRPLLSRRSAGEAMAGFKPDRCISSSAANAAGVV